MFGFFLKLITLRDSIKVLAAGFPDVLTDLETTFSDIEGMVLTKSWNLTSINKVISDGEQLYTDFVKDYTGSKAQLTAFLANLKALFV